LHHVEASTKSILQSYPTFSLKELEAANLLERKDFKYVFRACDLNTILAEIRPFYKLMKVGTDLHTDYLTDYFDTKDFKFYLQHHNGQLNRYKVRLRTYVQSAMHFFEVKFKNNKSWTSKHREKLDTPQVNINDFTSAITAESLESKIRVSYARVTMLSMDGTEKLTFDLNLKFEAEGRMKDMSNICIAEVKSKTHHPYVFRQELKRRGYRSMGLSKYCFGITQLYPHLKANNFKKTLHNIQKISA
jgi:hypothetical protein